MSFARLVLISAAVALPTLAGAGSYLAVQRLLLDNVLHRRAAGDHGQNVLLIGNLHVE